MEASLFLAKPRDVYGSIVRFCQR